MTAHALTRLLIMGLVVLWTATGGAVVLPKENPLILELREVDQVRLHGSRDELVSRLQTWRKNVDEYTLMQSGTNLNYIAWGVAFHTCYGWLDTYVCETVEAADGLVREALQLLGEAQPADRRAVLLTGIELVAAHAQKWEERDPASCAALLDEYEEVVRASGDLRAIYIWNRRAPILESNFLCHADRLAGEERAEFYAQREARLQSYLLDDTIPVANRTGYLWAWTEHLSFIGELSKAATIMDMWWKQHADEIQTPDYFNTRLWLAIFGEGDQTKAREILRRADALAAHWTRPSERRQYEALTKTYYEGLLASGYELKRLKHVEFTTRGKKAQDKGKAPTQAGRLDSGEKRGTK